MGRTVVSSALVHLIQEGYYDPCVAVLYDGEQVEFLYPRFQNEKERKEAFSKVNEYITESKAVAAVLVMETWYVPKNTSEKKEALMVLRKGHGVAQVDAYPFTREGGEIKIGEKISTNAQKDTMLTAFEAAN